MLNMDKQQIRIFIVMAAVIVLLTGYIVMKQLTGPQGQDLVPVTHYMEMDGGNVDEPYPHDTQQDKAPTDTEQMLVVYITGQVRYPGVYEVADGSRLADVVEMAGGFLEEADLLRINLALRVQDEGMYIVPRIGEEIPVEGLSDTGIDQAGGFININTADQKLLETLPGIGAVKAQNIIAYREQNGKFRSIEEIKNVSGIGDKIFERLKDLITVK